jgi:hypothetical protein
MQIFAARVTRMLSATRTTPLEPDPCREVHTPYAAYEVRIACSTSTSGFITFQDRKRIPTICRQCSLRSRRSADSSVPGTGTFEAGAFEAGAKIIQHTTIHIAMIKCVCVCVCLVCLVCECVCRYKQQANAMLVYFDKIQWGIDAAYEPAEGFYYKVEISTGVCERFSASAMSTRLRVSRVRACPAPVCMHRGTCRSDVPCRWGSFFLHHSHAPSLIFTFDYLLRLRCLSRLFVQLKPSIPCSTLL